MKLRAILAAAVMTAAGIVLGHAASATVSARTVGAGAASISRCDSDGVTVLENLSGSNIASVSVGSIASACGGATISVAVNNGSTSSSGSTTVPSGGGSVTVTLSSAVASSATVQVDVSIAGP